LSITGTTGDFAPAVRAVADPAGLSRSAQAALALALFAACCAPAAINGYPLVFPDTESYLISAHAFRPQFIRAFGYGAFIRVSGGLFSLWLTVAAQAALCAWLVTRAVALESPRWPARWRLPAALGMLAAVLLGHLPWLAAWVQPDVLTGLMLLALFLLVEHGDGVGRVERVLLLGTLVGCATVHLTHPPLLAGLGVFALGVLVLAWFREAGRALVRRVRRVAVLSLVAAALGWGALAGANYATYRSASSSLGGSVFLFARLAADGDVAAALRPECGAGKPWVACRFLDRFDLSADEFLWRAWSPLPEMGFGPGFQREAVEINPVLIRRIWPQWLGKSAVRAWAQLRHVALGDGMDDEGTWMLADNLPDHGMGWIADAAERSRQAEDDLRPLMPRSAAEALAIAGLLGSAWMLAFGAARRRPDLWWPALVFLVAYAGNAAIIALGGEVHDRYSARLVWLAPVLAGLLALRIPRRPSVPRVASGAAAVTPRAA
jgi:hypothetical protein